MTFEDLFNELRVEMKCASSMHSAQLAERLLRICRAAGAELRSAECDPELSGRRNHLTDDLRTLLSAGTSAMLTAGRLRDFEAKLAGSSALHGVALTARAAAVALDQQFGPDFYLYFAARGRSFLVGADVGFPVVPCQHFRLMKASGFDASGDPGLRSSRHDTLDYLRLAPSDMHGLEVEMVLCDKDLDGLTSDTRFAVGVLGQSIEADYEWDRYSGPSPLFFRVRPQNPERHDAQLQAVMMAIEKEAPDVVVLPELCWTKESFQRLRHETVLRNVPLLIMGSRHEHNGGSGGTNVSAVYAHGKLLGEHRKFKPVVFADTLTDDGLISTGQVKRQEHLLDLRHRVTVFCGAGLSFATVICKDAIDRAVREILSAFAVHLILVPAMSPTTEDFCDLANDLAADPQAFTVVANTGGTPAIFGKPTRNSRVISIETPTKSLVTFGLGGVVDN